MTFSLVVKNKNDKEYREIFRCENFDDSFLMEEIQRCRRNKISYHVEQTKKPVRCRFITFLLGVFK